MKKNRKIYTAFQLASAVCMIMALLWLTISAPFVNAFQQELAKQNKMENASTPLAATEEEAGSPFGNNTEEKAPSSTSFSEEFLHTHHTIDHFFSTILKYHKCEDADTYIAFHGELLVPPPNRA